MSKIKYVYIQYKLELKSPLKHNKEIFDVSIEREDDLFQLEHLPGIKSAERLSIVQTNEG